ncbi:2-oxo acid dehydrogenase subunit E2 [Streptomyces sp. NPDC101194]|uniref:2-oxo acid dehydrogenase subunit E2 n=1 Tax=Streptomyces sp. NPDC101194 TaxID=3366127 RepID=UPI003804FCAC
MATVIRRDRPGVVRWAERCPGARDAARTQAIEPRRVAQPALSCDHRLIDGQQGSELTADIVAVVHDPGLAMP